MLCSLVGRLDTLASQQAAKDIQPLLDNADKEIILDCSKLEYISSSGLRILLTIRKETARKGGKTIISGISDDIRQIMDSVSYARIDGKNVLRMVKKL